MQSYIKRSLHFPLFICIALLFQGCLSPEESRIKSEIKEDYKVKEIRIHDVEEENNGKQITVREVILLNSPVLKESKTDLEDGLRIARKFFRAMKNKEPYSGIRVIILNREGSDEMMGQSKNYYYDKDLLEH